MVVRLYPVWLLELGDHQPQIVAAALNIACTFVSEAPDPEEWFDFAVCILGFTEHSRAENQPTFELNFQATTWLCPSLFHNFSSLPVRSSNLRNISEGRSP
jgi:hypothetical protein